LLLAIIGGLVSLAVLAICYKSHNAALNVALLVALIVSLGVAVPSGVCAGRFARSIGRLTSG
jgi:pheromone shutdown protein TraB